MKKFLLIALVLALFAPAAMAQDLWLHVHVTGDDENVEVNVPLSLIEAVLPAVKDSHIQGGIVKIDDHDLDDVNVKELWTAVRDVEDGVYVTVRNKEESVRVAKENGFFLVKVDEKGEDGEKVNVKIPLAVVDALFQAGEDELDVLAAIKALGDYRGDLITVEESGGETVRIWIDTKKDIQS